MVSNGQIDQKNANLFNTDFRISDHKQTHNSVTTVTPQHQPSTFFKKGESALGFIYSPDLSPTCQLPGRVADRWTGVS